jgi:hypothetical protein
MTTIRTHTELTTRDLRSLERLGYEITVILTEQQTTADQNTVTWARQNGLDIPEHELPFPGGHLSPYRPASPHQKTWVGTLMPDPISRLGT